MSDTKELTKTKSSNVVSYEGMEEYSGTGFGEVGAEDLSTRWWVRWLLLT